MALTRDQITDIVNNDGNDQYPEAWSSVMDEVNQRPDQARKSVTAEALRELLLFQENSVSQAADLLDEATFVFPINSDPSKTSASLSGKLSLTYRKQLENMPLFDVKFKYADALEERVKDQSDLQFSAVPPPRTIKYQWSKLLERTFDYTWSDDEAVQLSHVRSALNPVLGLFGFHFQEKTGAKEDMEVKDISKGCLIAVGEIKRIQSLDVSVIEKASGELSAQFCQVGFAIHIARCPLMMPEAESLYKEKQKSLLKYLAAETGLSADNIGKGKSYSAEDFSSYAKEILENPQHELGAAVGAAKLSLAARQIISTTPFVLWGACMQACHYAVAKQHRYSLVCTARVFWLLELVVEKGKCVICTSRAFVFGEKGFIRTLVLFFQLAAGARLEGTDLDHWQKALRQTDGDGGDGGGGSSGTGQDAGASGGGGSSGGQGKGPGDGNGGGGFGNGSNDGSDAKHPGRPDKRRKSNVENATLTFSANPTMISRTVSIGDEENRNQEHRRYLDRAGLVAYFSDIRESGEVLGRGRCGTVVQAEWCGQPVALKSYEMHPGTEDERDFQDIYAQEHQVLMDLRSMWGTFVPEMLFHIPWRTGPVIGLQLGVPIKEDDMSKWNHTDSEKAKETIAAVRKCGWAQRDMRGNNFVRLQRGTDEFIAMIDFEDMVRVEE